MNLKSIKLAGFKSFADPTTILLPSNLTAVVGPNGCGKSNIVDALRWVIGESSAKQLRGEHLSDVIFNGASGRKPVGQASIELVFDNNQGRLGAEYANYAEISIRREITRDGQSQFYLNGTRCRRRDITDLFLGTGLGPHSYAIIEQGVISKIIEGKPEEIRIYLEEAAGTSKYRERRRDTENRIRHTRENLARLSDLRMEMEKQLDHLKRQASAAERYKVLKQEQRLMKAQLHALQYQALDHQVTEQQRHLDEGTNQLEARIADHRRIEALMEQHREQQAQANEEFNTVQARFYQVGGEVARQEQQIQHIQSQSRQLTADLDQLQTAYEEAEQHLEQDRFQFAELGSTLESLTPQTTQAAQAAEQAAARLHEVEQTRAEFQQQWEHFQQQASQAQRQAEVEETRVHHLSQQIKSLADRVAQLQQQQLKLNTTELPEVIAELAQQTLLLKNQLDALQHTQAELNQRIAQQRHHNDQSRAERDQEQQALNQLLNQQASLNALQQAALGKENQQAQNWLKQHGWTDKPRLLEVLQVEKGWETAVETVLAPYLEAICTTDTTDLQTAAQQFTEGRLAIFHPAASATVPSTKPGLTSIASKIQSSWSLTGLLDGIYVVEDTQQALQQLPQLASHESIVTRSGIWLGVSWLRISKVQDETSGVLQRKQALQDIDATVAEQQQKLVQYDQTLQQGQAQLLQLERERDQQQQQFRELSHQYSQQQSQLSAKQAHYEQLQHQHQTVTQDYEHLQQQRLTAEQELQTVQASCEQARQERQTFTARQAELSAQKNTLEAEFQQLRQQAAALKQTADEIQVRLASTESQRHYLQQNIARAERQLQQTQQRREQILARQNEVQAPLAELQAQLEELLQERVVVEEALTREKQKLSELDHQWREYEKQRTDLERQTQVIREQIERIRIAQTTAQAHRENHLEQISGLNYTLPELLQEMPTEAQVDTWQQELERVETRIQRLGAINLAAIEEFETLSERKTYLDSQDKDLCEALQTLEEAIQKIDRESRARLRETFDKANAQFKDLFHRMFEGGQAELEWVGDEVLSAGVVIRAQPPGKRNTLLHMLSGGEKALTSIALVFALFQLNPAPFCVLDEVDAPLDEANVGRFSRLVKSMSATVQFLFISHNKVTMQMAQQLIGITMQEPGVSRLVSVDMDEALAMAEVA
jgi:chromosome segregation protein